MPYLRCPECLESNSFKKTEVSNAKCLSCNYNLYDHFYLGRDEQSAKIFVNKENERIKQQKNRIKREENKQSKEGFFDHNVDQQDQHNENTTFGSNFFGYIGVPLFFLVVVVGFQYMGMRSSVQTTTLDILKDENIIVETDDINLPISIIFSNPVNATVFLKKNKYDVNFIEVEVIPKGIPVLSLITGMEYWVQISGIEMMKLRLN